MARTVITLESRLFDDPRQEVSVRENLPIRILLAETRREFNLDEASYTLNVKSSGKLLDPDKTLEQSGVQTGAVLVLNRERRAPVREVDHPSMLARTPIKGSQRASLRETTTGQTFELQWSPAIVGRPDTNNPASAEQLAVNLGGFEGAQSVSRHHARIIEQSGHYFLECAAEHNPVYLDDVLLRLGERRILQPGSKVRLGKIELTFELKQNG